MCYLGASEVMQVTLQVIKTWSNAWVTSNRFHESSRLPCLWDAPAGQDQQEQGP